MSKLIEVIGDSIIIGYGILTAFFFYEFWRYGKIWVFEPNTWIAFGELLLSIAIILIGINRLIGDFRK